MNINFHFQGNFCSLGLDHIQGSLNATKAIKLVEVQLQLFDLNLNKDVVGTTTDGTSLMLNSEKTLVLNMGPVMPMLSV